jgi:hypothetical protein
MKKIEAMTNFNFEQGFSVIYQYLKDIDNIGSITYKRYSDNHVFDANKSVNWNREEVVRKNKEIKENNELVRNIRRCSERNMIQSLIETISKEYNIPTKAALKIIELCKKLFDNCWYEYLDDVIEFYMNTINNK